MGNLLSPQVPIKNKETYFLFSTELSLPQIIPLISIPNVLHVTHVSLKKQK